MISLPEMIFCGYIRAFLVNMKFIKNISRYRVLLNNGILLDIRARYKYVEEKFIAYRGEV